MHNTIHLLENQRSNTLFNLINDKFWQSLEKMIWITVGARCSSSGHWLVTKTVAWAGPAQPRWPVLATRVSILVDWDQLVAVAPPRSASYKATLQCSEPATTHQPPAIPRPTSTTHYLLLPSYNFTSALLIYLHLNHQYPDLHLNTFFTQNAGLEEIIAPV